MAEIQAHYTIEAEDGSPIYFRNFGLRVANDDTRSKLIAGEAVDAEQYYFRSPPVFDAPDGPHQWLREHVFVCDLKPVSKDIEVTVFCVH